jgi:hypothetical protein
MEGNIRSVRPYKKTLVITVPDTSAAESRDAPALMKVKSGPAVTVQNSDSANANVNTATVEMGIQANEPAEFDPPFLPTENVPKVH